MSDIEPVWTPAKIAEVTAVMENFISVPVDSVFITYTDEVDADGISREIFYGTEGRLHSINTRLTAADPADKVTVSFEIEDMSTEEVVSGSFSAGDGYTSHVVNLYLSEQSRITVTVPAQGDLTGWLNIRLLIPKSVAPAFTTILPTTAAPTTTLTTTLTTLAPTTLLTTPIPTTLLTTEAPTTLAPTTIASTTIAPTTLIPTTLLTTFPPPGPGWDRGADGFNI